MFNGQTIQLHSLPNDLVELRFDRQAQSINKLDSASIAELRAATNVIKKDASIRGVLVTSAKTFFIVGADIFEFSTLFAESADNVERFIAGQSAVFTAFEDLPVPIVTAINGMALGGGFEMALASDYRVAAETAQVGLPEITLGIFPAFGGCVRLPRLIGAATALQWIVSGKPQLAEVARNAGAVDAVVANDTLREAALNLLESTVASGEWRSRRASRCGAATVGDTDAIDALEAATAKTAINYPAGAAAARLIAATAGLDRDAALVLEARAFAGVATTPTAAALIQLFVNDQLMKKKAAAFGRIARKVNRAAVVGAGIMGAGIAYTSASRKIPVLMKDISQSQLDLGRREADKLTGKQVAAGRMNAEVAASIGAAITSTLDYSGFGMVDAVVEAVLENLQVKQSIFAELESQVGVDTVLASNTSSLSITGIAATLQRPENFAGMHFFNPVPMMPLVEVIRGERTSDTAAATVAAYAGAMGKTPVVVKDCPGFLVNRIFTPYVVGFLKLIRDGADFEQVDEVMEAFGWPMGPAYLLDVIGLDTGSHVFETIIRGYPQRMQLDFPDAIRLLAGHQRLGQKSGLGFYRYETSPQGKPLKFPSPEAHALIAEFQPAGRARFDPEAIVQRMMLPMVIEAAVCLFDQVVETAAEIDTSMILGLGFPRFRGGPLKYADQLGLAAVLSQSRRLGLLDGAPTAAARLEAMVQSGARFHDPTPTRASGAAPLTS